MRMLNMRATIAALCVLVPVFAHAAGAASNYPMEPMEPDLDNKPSLQAGMALYTNYCLGCHGMKFQRYERTADDLGIPHDVALETVVPAGTTVSRATSWGIPRSSAVRS